MLGYGANSFFEVLSNLATMFFLIFLFTLPILYFYSRGERYASYDLFPIFQFFIGNIGGSTTFCRTTRMGFGELEATCPPNQIFDAKNAVFGVLSNQHKQMTHCHEKAISDYMWDHPEIIDCSKMVKDKLSIKKTIESSCDGEAKCTIIFDQIKFVSAIKNVTISNYCND